LWRSSGKIKYVNKSASKLKKYISVSKNGEVTFSKGAPKGIYKIKVTVGKTANNSKTVQTIKIRVK
jgi:hypothetical protein